LYKIVECNPNVVKHQKENVIAYFEKLEVTYDQLITYAKAG